LYQLAYQKFITDHGFTNVKNCFLLPTDKSQVIDKGEVELEMLSNIELQNIQVRFLPAEQAYSDYLSGKKMDIGELLLHSQKGTNS
jgi:hypothetical protein